MARVLSGKVLLPTEKEMMDYVEDYYQKLDKLGVPKHFTHYLNFDEVFMSVYLLFREFSIPDRKIYQNYTHY